jgi:hypothetical protein
MAKIRKFTAFLAFTLFLCVSVDKLLAQSSSYYEEDPRTFYAGPIIGGNFTQVDGDNYAGYHKVGITVGGILYANLAEKIAASMEILYSQKGATSNMVKESAIKGIILNKYRLNLNYAEIPIQLNYFDKRKSHFGAGFSYSQLIGTRETATVTPTSYVVPDFEKDYPVKKMDINFIFGGNLHLIKGLFLNIRFQYSLIPIRTNVAPGFGRTQQFNNMWTIRLMYLFI